MIGPVSITAVPGVPDIHPGDDLADVLGTCLAAHDPLQAGDILCVAHKVVSKAEGNVVDLTRVTPSPRAREIAAELGKNPAKVEVILEQSSRIVRAFKRPEQNEGTLICEHPKIGPHAQAMRARMAELMGMDMGRVSVKATTSERLGFTGRGEGIACIATATLVKP